MKKTALITGILGQDGPYLARLLLEKDYKVYGMIRRHHNQDFSNTDYLQITDRLEFISGDMIDEASLLSIIKTVKPDEVYNLAAQSFVGESWAQSIATTEVNALGALYLLNAIKILHPTAKFYQASTSEMFGASGMNGLLSETSQFYPKSPYGISKLYAHWMTINFRESYGMFCASGILFNHESPIRGEQFVTRKISRGVAEIKCGMRHLIQLGEIDAKRDWGFAGDFVEAMWLMLQMQEPDDYVIATGVMHSVREFLDFAFQHIGVKNWEQYVKIDPALKRPAEVYALQGDAGKAREKLGWRPKIGFEELVRMMVDEDIKRLQKA